MISNKAESRLLRECRVVAAAHQAQAALSFSVCVIFLRNEVRHRHLVVEADGFGLRGPSWRHILDAAYWHR